MKKFVMKKTVTHAVMINCISFNSVAHAKNNAEGNYQRTSVAQTKNCT